MKNRKRNKKGGFSLLELLAVVTILGIIAVTVSSDTAKQRVMEHHKATINSAVERYYVNEGSWPADDLSDISVDVDYFPDGIPTNPVDSSAYTLNTTTKRVN